jgi:hypothetical protein
MIQSFLAEPMSAYFNIKIHVSHLYFNVLHQNAVTYISELHFVTNNYSLLRSEFSYFYENNMYS